MDPKYKEWLASLKVNDKVAIQYYIPGAGYRYCIGTVTKRTPTGQIRINNDKLYKDGQSPYTQYEDGTTLCQLTPEIEEAVFRRETCAKLRSMIFDELPTEKLKRIMEIIGD